MKQPTDTKEVYEKPTIVTKQVEMATVAGQYTGGGGPIGILWPVFGICCGGGS